MKPLITMASWMLWALIASLAIAQLAAWGYMFAWLWGLV